MNPTMRCWSSAALLLMAGALRAAVVVELPPGGDYRVWVTDPSGAVVAGPAASTGGKVVLVTGKAAPSKRTLSVLNGAGNAARKPIPAGVEPRITITSEDFSLVGRVALSLTDAKGSAPDAVAVTLTDAAKTVHRAVLTGADRGRAVFPFVASGDASITVWQGSADNAQTQSLRIPRQRTTPGLELQVPVTLPEGMKPVAAPSKKADTGEKGSEPAAAPEPGDAGRRAGGILGLFLLGAVGWLAFNYLRGKGITAEDALSRAGIRVEPDAPAVEAVAAPEPPVDPSVCRFCGERKDPVTGACACTLSPSSAPYAPTSAPGTLRLIALTGPNAGSSWDLDRSLSVGRDASQDVAVPDDNAMSRRHATLEPRGATVEVVDLGSSNGTFVNGSRVSRQALAPGDEVVLGGTRFRIEGGR